MAETKATSQPCMNIVLLGDARAGKSASGNTILGWPAFATEEHLKKANMSFQKETVTIAGIRLGVYDTPALLDLEANKEKSAELCKVFLTLDTSDPTVFLLVIRSDSFTDKQKRYAEEIEKRLGEWHLNTWLLFTGGDELKRRGTTAEKWIRGNEELTRLVERFQNRYHVFNNQEQTPDQVEKLIESLNRAPLAMFPERKTFPRTKPNKKNDHLERRIMLLGKTGVGKSATGNTILNKNKLKSERSFRSVTSQSEMHQETIAGKKVSVVDTPGFFDTQLSPVELANAIGKSIYMSSPGPHAFLYVVPLTCRFTDQEVQVVQYFEKMFGEDMRRYTIILFTHGELFEGINIASEIEKNNSLSSLVQQCGGRYHVFNNNDWSNREQVIKLLEKIDRMVEQNGGNCYSNKMYEEAEKIRNSDSGSGLIKFLRKFWSHFLLAGIIAVSAITFGVIIFLFAGTH